MARRLGLLALAATSVGGLNVGRLSSVKLKPVNDGRASNVLEVEAGWQRQRHRRL